MEKHINGQERFHMTDEAYDLSGVAWVLVALCGSQIGHPLFLT